MSRREAGRRLETRIQKYLESLGWVVDKARAAVKFIGPGKFVSSRNDFWGFGDLSAIHPLRDFTLVVQTTLDSGVGRKRERAESIPWNLNVQRIQVWQPVASIQSGMRVLWLRKFTEPATWEDYIFKMKPREWPPSRILDNYLNE